MLVIYSSAASSGSFPENPELRECDLTYRCQLQEILRRDVASRRCIILLHAGTI
jgi:hypothetical protein